MKENYSNTINALNFIKELENTSQNDQEALLKLQYKCHFYFVSSGCIDDIKSHEKMLLDALHLQTSYGSYLKNKQIFDQQNMPTERIKQLSVYWEKFGDMSKNCAIIIFIKSIDKKFYNWKSWWGLKEFDLNWGNFQNKEKKDINIKDLSKFQINFNQKLKQNQDQNISFDPKCDLNVFINDKIRETKQKLNKPKKIVQLDNIIQINDYNSLMHTLNKIKDKLIVAQFETERLFTCKQINSHMLSKLSEYINNDAYILKINCDNDKNISKKQNVKQFPQFIFFKNGMIKYEQVGAEFDKIIHCIEIYN